MDLDPRDQEAIKARKNVAAEASLRDTGFETAKSSQDLVKDKGVLARLEQEQRIFKTEADLQAQKAQIEKRLESDPDNADLLQDLAEVLVKMDDVDGAMAVMDKAIAARPGDMSILFAKGDIEMNRIESEILAMTREGRTEEAAARQADPDRAVPAPREGVPHGPEAAFHPGRAAVQAGPRRRGHRGVPADRARPQVQGRVATPAGPGVCVQEAVRPCHPAAGCRR